MSCFLMLEIEKIIEEINEKHQIRVDNSYIERLKRLLCGYLCAGHNKGQIYAVEGSSYDGCNGWSSWIMENTTTKNYEKAIQSAKERRSTYVRTKVVMLK